MGWFKTYLLSKGVEIHHGTTRTVFLIGKYAIKVPYLKSYFGFVKGIIANILERDNSKHCPNYFLPVLWSLPLGLLVVMPRVRPINKSTWYFRAFLADLFHANNDNNAEALLARKYCEHVPKNYALYKGRPFCIDYGTFWCPDSNERMFILEMEFFVIKTKTLAEKINNVKINDPLPISQKPVQMDLDVLDIPIFAPHVESKGCRSPHEVDENKTPTFGHVPWEEVRVGDICVPRVVPYNRFTRRVHAKKNRLRLSPPVHPVATD